MFSSLPEFGTAVLCGILISSSYSLAVALAAAGNRPRLLQAARSGAYGTIALVGLALLVLAYAFITHDYRLDYVTRYSDRTMSTPWLIAALWGGQDGSLLSWLFLTALFAGLAVYQLKGRYLQLQPYIIVTLMAVLVFLAIVMLFAVNPFRTLVAGAPAEGMGLNYQLRNFYMIIHPPALYIGFTSAAVPFAFAVAALATGRLDNEWIIASRRWMLFCWLFLTIGNALGMAWAYEELGWGGYWAWDPVENASFLPWLTASAYVHSAMIQERRGGLKLLNLILICLTFFLTYFGTFLTRSGLIASVHSFGESSVGIFLAYFMGVIILTCLVLIAYRLRELRSKPAFESLLSKEFAFVAGIVVLLSMMLFVKVATVYPRLSEWLLKQESIVGPPFYNALVPPMALLLVLLMGTAPLLGWRKTTQQLFIRSFRWPVAVMVVVMVLHVWLGERIGFPHFVEAEPAFAGWLGAALAGLQGKLPVISVGLVAYNLAVVTQELLRGIQARRKSKNEGFIVALGRLLSRSRRRYGGYLAHAGVAVMIFGFVGRSWGVTSEASVMPGETFTVAGYTLTYTGSENRTDNPEYTSLFAHLDVSQNGSPIGRLSPEKRFYRASPQRPAPEVAMNVTFREDLYVILGMLNTRSQLASFQIHINPLVAFVWLGLCVLCAGALIAMWPERSRRRAGARVGRYGRALAAAATIVMLAVLLASATSARWSEKPQPLPEDSHDLG